MFGFELSFPLTIQDEQAVGYTSLEFKEEVEDEDIKQVLNVILL